MVELMRTIQRDKELDLGALIMILNKHIPGPLNEQKLTHVDTHSVAFCTFSRRHYANFLSLVIPRVLPLNNCEIVLKKCLIIEHSNLFTLYYALLALLEQLNSYSHACKNRDRFLSLLIGLLENQYVFLSLFCLNVEEPLAKSSVKVTVKTEHVETRGNDKDSVEEGSESRLSENDENRVKSNLVDASWANKSSFKNDRKQLSSNDLVFTADEIVNVLCNISVRVSNIVKLDLPPFFAYLHVEKVVLCHILNSVRMSFELYKHDAESYEATFGVNSRNRRRNSVENVRNSDAGVNKLPEDSTSLLPKDIDVEASENQHKPINLYLANKLFDKCLAHFKLKDPNSDHMKFIGQMIELFEIWIQYDRQFFSSHLGRLFDSLSNRSMELLVINMFRNIHDPSVCLDLCSHFTHDEQFQYLITYKLVYQNYYDVFAPETNTLIRNLVVVLWSTDKLAFRCVLENVLKLWSNYHVIVHANINQHAYISKLLINMVAYTTRLAVSSEEKLELLKPSSKDLLNGIMSYLKCSNEVVRYVGMISGDLILQLCNEAEAAVDGNEGKPKCVGFDYEKVSQDAKRYVDNFRAAVDETLKDLAGRMANTSDENNKENNVEECEQASTNEKKDNELRRADDIITELLEEYGILEKKHEKSVGKQNKRKCNKKDEVNRLNESTSKDNLNRTSNENQVSEDIVEDVQKVKNPDESAKKGVGIDSDDDGSENSFLLDSDDEFEPISDEEENQSNLVAKKVPKYLRDLREYLTTDHSKDSDGNSAEIWTRCLKSASRIIAEQLPHDDVHIGMELLSVMVVIDKEFYCEDFEQYRMDICLAIVSVYPKQCATHLCDLFTHQSHQYNVKQKLFILDVLAQSAHALSSFGERDSHSKPMTASKQISKADNNDDKLEKEIVGKLIWRSRKLDLQNETASSRSKLTVNEFANIVPHFFYPLIRGKCKTDVFIPLKKTITEQEALLEEIRNGDVVSAGANEEVRSGASDVKSKIDVFDVSRALPNKVEMERKMDEIIVIRIMRTLAVILLASKHSIHNLAMCKEMLEFLFAFKQDGGLGDGRIQNGGNIHVNEELKMAILYGLSSVILSVSSVHHRELEVRWVIEWCMINIADANTNVRDMSRQVLALYMTAFEDAGGSQRSGR